MLRDARYMPALVATRFNDGLKAVHERLLDAGKPAKLAIAAIMRKIVVLANALIRDDRKWATKNLEYNGYSNLGRCFFRQRAFEFFDRLAEIDFAHRGDFPGHAVERGLE